MEKESPFTQLAPADQQAAVDIGVALAVIEARVSLSKSFTDRLIIEFAGSRKISLQLARYALRHVGAALFDQDWEYHCSKKATGLTTEFRQTSAGPNGGTLRS